LKKIEDDVVKLEAKLARRDFLDKAPEEIIEKEQAKYQGLRERAGKLAEALESIRLFQYLLVGVVPWSIL
jgi:valyl-tRNA synthetase